MDLIREILIFAEQHEDAWFARGIEIEGWDQKDIVYNVGLAVDADFLVGGDSSVMGPDGADYLIDRMTYRGHEFLDQIRSDNVWNRLKALAKEQGIDLSVDLVKQLAPKILAQIIGTGGK